MPREQCELRDARLRNAERLAGLAGRVAGLDHRAHRGPRERARGPGFGLVVLLPVRVDAALERCRQPQVVDQLEPVLLDVEDERQRFSGREQAPGGARRVFRPTGGCPAAPSSSFVAPRWSCVRIVGITARVDWRGPYTLNGRMIATGRSNAWW